MFVLQRGHRRCKSVYRVRCSYVASFPQKKKMRYSLPYRTIRRKYVEKSSVPISIPIVSMAITASRHRRHSPLLLFLVDLAVFSVNLALVTINIHRTDFDTSALIFFLKLSLICGKRARKLLAKRRRHHNHASTSSQAAP